MTEVEFRTKCLATARAELGVAEVPGDQDNPRIEEYKASTPAVAGTHDEVPWCSSFVNWVVQQVGDPGTKNAMARSWLKWGVAIPAPRIGAIVVIWRGPPPMGHVGFIHDLVTVPGFIHVIGGNQSDRVKVSTYRADAVLGYRTLKENI